MCTVTPAALKPVEDRLLAQVASRHHVTHLVRERWRSALMPGPPTPDHVESVGDGEIER
jgi:hypothetical protein